MGTACLTFVNAQCRSIWRGLVLLSQISLNFSTFFIGPKRKCESIERAEEFYGLCSVQTRDQVACSRALQVEQDSPRIGVWDCLNRVLATVHTLAKLVSARGSTQRHWRTWLHAAALPRHNSLPLDSSRASGGIQRAQSQPRRDNRMQARGEKRNQIKC